MDQAQRFRQGLLDAASGVARTLPEVPPDIVEDRLVSFDVLLESLGGDWRPEAASLLRAAAERCPDAERRNRLLQAALSVEVGEPCGRTPEGLTAKEAAAASTVGLEDARDPSDAFTVRDFRLGMRIRVKRGFRDFDGKEIRPGETLRFQTRTYFHYDGGHTLYFEEKTIRLAEIVPANVPVIENRDGAYFEVVRAGPAEPTPTQQIRGS